MKVVLFCGGMGTRLREHSDTIPKPLVSIGTRPVLWNLMRYYAHFGHKDFVLALGYRGDLVREYFLNYSEAMSSDFTLNVGSKSIELKDKGLEDCRITFVDTGLHSNIGQRLMRVRQYLKGEEMFLANYADGLSDMPMNEQIDSFRNSDAVAFMVTVRSSQSFHAVQSGEDGVVTRMGALQDQALWINGGFFVFRSSIFDYINEGEELVEKPFDRLVEQRKLRTVRWEGFWQCMDTLKDKIALDRMEARGTCPWVVWNK